MADAGFLPGGRRGAGIADLAVRLLPEALGPYPQQLQPQSEALFDAWPSYEKLDCKTPHSPDLRIECL